MFAPDTPVRRRNGWISPCSRRVRVTSPISRRPRRKKVYHSNCSYRLGWPVTPPGVGRSFLAERLGMTLTSRLRTPPDRPSHHAWPGPLSFPPHPGSPGAILGCIFPNRATQRQNSKARQSTSRIDTAVSMLVGYSRGDPMALYLCQQIDLNMPL